MESFVGVANGVHTAYIETVEALENHDQVSVSQNYKKPYDITHFHTIGPYYLWKSLFMENKMVVTAHVIPESFLGSIILSRLWNPVAKLYLKFAYNRSDVIQAVSPLVKKKLREIGVKKPIQVICNSVDRKKFRFNKERRKKFRRKLGLSRDDFIALCVGQIQPRKGIDTFMEVADRLPKVNFVWVGDQIYGRLTAQYQRMCQLMERVSDNVIFTGKVPFEEIPGYYNTADVFFFPSYQENFPFVILEAASSGLPLVLRNNPEYESTLFNNYLKADSTDGFHSLIEKLLNDPHLLARYQQRSLNLADEYDKESFARKLVDLYRSVINS